MYKIELVANIISFKFLIFHQLFKILRKTREVSKNRFLCLTIAFNLLPKSPMILLIQANLENRVYRHKKQMIVKPIHNLQGSS